jgi:hypothetical protein
MPFSVDKSILKAIAIVGIAGAVVIGMQVHLWQARASNGRQATPSAMSSFIHALHSTDYVKGLPVLVVEDPI